MNPLSVITISCVIALLCSCSEDKEINLLKKTVKQSFLLEAENIEIDTQAFYNINCYIFKDSIFYKTLRNITLENDRRITLEVPEMAQLYFLTNIEEPNSLATLEEGKTDLPSFLSKRSNDISLQSYWNAPEFYSGVATANSTLYTDNSSKIKLYSGVSRINIDISSDELILIDSVEMNGASLTTQLFKGTESAESIHKQNYSRKFKPSVTGIVTDIFKAYESNTPVNFTFKGTYNKIPIVINKSIAKLERNETYTIKIAIEDIEIIPNTNIHILIPDSKGRLDIPSAQASQIHPGSTIYLNGRFLSIRITGLKGSIQQPIHITNYPGKKLVLGNPDWAGGAYSSAIQLMECQHIILGGEKNISDFNIESSTQQTVQSSYFGVNLRPFTDNVEVRNMTIKNGGTGIVAKTDPQKNEPNTWYPNTQLENLSIHDVVISGTADAAMYIGHTALWWGWDEDGRGYNAGANPENPAHTYVMPIRWKNVKIYNNYVHHLGYDGIQASAIDLLEIYGNEVADFGLRKIWGQCMGIIVGGRTTNTNTHDNYVHDGFGELFQFHGANENNATHIVHNNLFVNTQGSGMGIYGATDATKINITNNTVVGCQTYAVQANGRYFETQLELSNNVFISYYQKDPNLQKDFWIINGAKIEDTDNKRFDSPANALVAPNNFYQPLFGSPIGEAGYRRAH